MSIDLLTATGSALASARQGVSRVGGVYQAATRADALSAAIPSDVTIIQTLAFAVQGDGGGGYYKELGAAPTLTSNLAYLHIGSRWFGLLPEKGAVNFAQFGYKPDFTWETGTGTDNFAAFTDCIAFIVQGFPYVVPNVIVPPGAAYYSDTLEFKGGATTWICRGNAAITNNFAAEWVFPANKAGLIIARADTHLDGVVAATVGGDGTTIEGIHISSKSLGNRADGNYDGIWCRARGVFRNIGVTGFPRDNFVVKATSQFPVTDPTTHGNANGVYVENFQFRAAGRHNTYCVGADANACTFKHGLCRDSNGWGVLDNSFLRNTWVAVWTDGNGHADRAACKMAHHNGKVWLLAYEKESVSATTEPGTNSSVWIEYYDSASPDSQSVAWDGVRTFLDGGAFAGNAVFIGVYSEANQKPCDLGDNAIFTPILNAAGYSPRSSTAAAQKGNTFLNGVISALHDTVGFFAALGGDQVNDVALTLADQRPGGMQGIYRLRGDRVNKNVIFDEGLTNRVFTITGKNTTSTHGPYCFIPERLLLPGTELELASLNSAPGGVTGYPVIVFNTNPSSGQPAFWFRKNDGTVLSGPAYP